MEKNIFNKIAAIAPISPYENLIGSLHYYINAKDQGLDKEHKRIENVLGVKIKRTSKTISVFDGVREVKMFDKGGVISLQFKKLVRD